MKIGQMQKNFIGVSMRAKIILEIGYNHNGSMTKAKGLIREAAKLNVWAVKFQKWDIEGFPEELKNMKRSDKNAYGPTYYEHRKYLEFSIEQLKELKEYSEKKGLNFCCSGKDFNSIKQLVEELNCKIIKVPSQRYRDNQIFRYLYKERKERGLKIIVSTGMLYEDETKKSRWIDKDGADIIMHCVSLYPARKEDVNLIVMRNSFYNGYSSHEINGDCIKYAVALGADYIERHFTLDNNDKGTDHKVSSTPDQMLNIIKDIEEVEKIVSTKRSLTEQEKKHRKFYWGF